jgi:tetratricopeptide (TPR) repeat protein
MIPATLLALLAVTTPDAEDDLVLAAALARRGWIELAEELCEKVRKDPRAGAKARSNVPLVMAEVAVEKARRESRGAEVARILDASLATLRVEPRPALEVRTTIGWVLGEKARLLATVAELEEDRESRGTAAAEAARASGEFEAFERAMIDDLRKMPSTPEVESALLEARFELPRAILSRARLPGGEEGPRRALLKQALDGFVDVEFDTLPPASWEAQIEEGRCHTELGDFPRAEAKLQEILDLRKLLARKAQPEPLLHRATLYLAQCLVAARKGRAALALVDGFLNGNPALANAGIGFALLLEKGSALHGLGNTPGAIALGLQVERVDPDGPLGKLARQRIRSWVGEGKGSPSVWMTLAEAENAQGRHRDAAKTLRRAIEACSTPAEKASFEPAATFKQGECFRALHQELEAAAAFEQVFRRWPAHELAVRAGVEAVRSVAREAALSGNPADGERLGRLLVDVEKLGPGVDSVKFLHAELCERKGQLQEAAELYRGVGEANEFFAQSMVSSAHCWRVDAAKRGKDEAVRELGLAQEALRRFLAWTEVHALDARIVGIAWRELAAVYAHPLVGRPKDALECLGKKGAQEGQDAEGRLRAWELQVQVQIAEGKTDDAGATLDQMLKERADAPATVRSCRLVFRALDRATEELVRAKADASRVRESARRSADRASRWVDLAKRQAAPPSTPELVEAADSLYHSARRLNDFGDEVVSFMDLKGKAVSERKPWEAAASVHGMLVELRREDFDAKDRLVAEIRLSRCLAFFASDTKEWERAKAQYDSIVRGHRMLDAAGQLDPAVLQAQTSLFPVYLELGEAYFELGKRGQKFQFENALTIFTNVTRVTVACSGPWWHSKYRMISSLYERGEAGDIRMAVVLLDNLERNNPGFDGGKFGLKDQFAALGEKIRKVAGR